MLHVAEMVCKTAKQGVREWCSSTTGPLLPTMTDSLLAPSREVLYPPPPLQSPPPCKAPPPPPGDTVTSMFF